jgi:hypothetical protein
MNMRLFLLITSMILSIFFSVTGIAIISMDVTAKDAIYNDEQKIISLESSDALKTDRIFDIFRKYGIDISPEGKMEYEMAEYIPTLSIKDL